MNANVQKQSLQDLLDSDDELPTSYDDVADIPAYQNDSRFVPVKFHWLDKQPVKSNIPQTSLYALLNEDVVNEKAKNLKCGEKILIKKGILSKKDIYCLQCIEASTSDATMLWFINFLTYKDLQSPYKYLTSCLVGNIFSEYSIPNAMWDWESKQYKYQIIQH